MKKFRIFFFLLVCFTQSSDLKAAGAILVDTETSGLPVIWEDGVIHFNLERAAGATLGTLSNDEAVALVLDLFDEWKNTSINGVVTTSLTL